MLRWPLITRARYDRELTIAVNAIRTEYDRATVDGKAKVHAWARDAAANFFHVDSYRAKGAAVALFQQAEQQFDPKPLALSEVLYAPANPQEAIDRAQ